jgi:hypothetical protein
MSHTPQPLPQRRLSVGTLSPQAVSNYKTMRSVIRFSLLFVVALFSCPRWCSAQTDFDTRHTNALHHNPSGVKLSLRTKNGNHTFHLFETIPIVLAYSSSRPSTFAIEMDETMNFAGHWHTFDVDQPDAVLLSWGEAGSYGVVCCATDLRYLSENPISFERELTDYLRFDKPGTYRFFVTTRRVFKEGRKYLDFDTSKIRLVSNILEITIIPDDPDWDAKRLSRTLAKLSDPHVLADHHALEQSIDHFDPETTKYEARANQLDQTQLALARKALNALDTPAAIAERVRRMDMLSLEDIRSTASLGGEQIIGQPLLESSTRPDLVVAALESRAQIPGFRVDYDFAYWWAQYLVARDHPEVLHLFADESQHQSQIHSFLVQQVEAEKDIATRLESFLESKHGVAREVTTITIKSLKDDVANWEKPSSPAPPPH